MNNGLATQTRQPPTRDSAQTSYQNQNQNIKILLYYTTTMSSTTLNCYYLVRKIMRQRLYIGRRKFCLQLRLKKRTRKSFKRNRKTLQQRKGGLHLQGVITFAKKV